MVPGAGCGLIEVLLLEVGVVLFAEHEGLEVRVLADGDHEDVLDVIVSE